jgi:two-component system CheB/CheR fusion protein
MSDQVEPAEPSPNEGAQSSSFVVGLGASAGGIAALKDFFARVEPQPGVAYVIILHLSPDHDSRLAEVLQAATMMPVAQVTTSTPIVPGHVYVVPPNRSLSIARDVLMVSDITRPEQRRAPVDVFFRALADSHRHRAVCVVLSGTGSNGSAGLKRIKEYGGLVIAQDPAEAEYGDMPRNALATGLVDMTLPIAEIPARIGAYFARLCDNEEAPPAPAADPQDGESIRDVLSVLRVRTGHDFGNYKPGTLHRRVERRMNLRGVPTLSAYALLLRAEPEEATALMKELLISVTNFFRDGDAWKAVEQQVVPKLFFNKRAQDEVRVWVAGCATGEEAFSVAMLLAEHAAALEERPAIQVFATDLDQRSLARAREAWYSDAEVAEVHDERLQRFFQREAAGFRLRRDLRELVLFAHHNVIKDPPFSHLDLICCRNLLIYLNRAIQNRVMETFHFALRPGGFLFLGTSESPDGRDDLFGRVDGNAHIFAGRPVTTRVAMPPTAPPSLVPRVAVAPDQMRRDRILPVDLHHRLLERYAPPSVIVTEDQAIVHMSERVGRYLELRGGEPTRDLLALAHRDLRSDLRAALHRAIAQRTNVDIRSVAVGFDEGSRAVDISVKPALREGDPARGYLLVTFHEQADVPIEHREPVVTLTSPAEPVAPQLEEELARVKAQLRATIEQYETQAEETKATNEELQATNEELRSAAEELETSKEELQSVNEELTTVNQELKIKIEELGHTNNDFHNFINATDIGTIFLDRELRVKLSTPRARDVFNLLPSDVGRPLSDITSRLRYEGIHADARTVLDRLAIVERELDGESGRWYSMRMLPYRTTDNRIEGVVITFQDITDRQAAQHLVRQREERLRALIDTALDYAIFTMTDQGIIDSWNPGAERMFGYVAHEIVGESFDRLFTPEDRAAGAHLKELEEARQNGRAADERYHVKKSGARIYCSGVTRRLGSSMGLAKIARDLTEQRRAAEFLQHAHDDLERRVSERTSELQRSVIEHQAAKQSVTTILHRLVSAQEDERRRIARDLHDHFGQQLTALRLALERGQHADRGPSADIATALDLTRHIGHDLEFLAWELRPTALDELGLAAALPRFVTEWSEHVGVPAEFRFGGFEQGHLPHDAEVGFYRVAQEALNNISKHAHATRVDVVLASRDGEVVLVVEDDGVGFDATDADIRSKGFGLAGMRERAALVGATLDLESAQGKGTSIFLRRRIGSSHVSPESESP